MFHPTLRLGFGRHQPAGIFAHITHCHTLVPAWDDGRWPTGWPLEVSNIWVCLKIVYPFLPNGFADHYPVFKWLFHWEYTLFSDKPIYKAYIRAM